MLWFGVCQLLVIAPFAAIFLRAAPDSFSAVYLELLELMMAYWREAEVAGSTPLALATVPARHLALLLQLSDGHLADFSGPLRTDVISVAARAIRDAGCHVGHRGRRLLHAWSVCALAPIRLSFLQQITFQSAWLHRVRSTLPLALE